MKRPHIMVIDPGVIEPELNALNHLMHLSPVPLTYHLPALFGVETLSRDEEAVTGIIVFGSASSVNERKPWQVELERWLHGRIEQGVPTLGICYGHQMLAHMFGGKVDYLFPDRRKLLGFREVRLEPDPLWGGQSIKGKVCISHNEAVVSVPETMKVIGASDDVKVDALKHRSRAVWSFQFHPEATPDFLAVRGYSGCREECHQFGYSLLNHFLNFAGKK
jgi:GMP synthase (glutamine-hydrolysing)